MRDSSVGVVIPYYQRDAGILSRALRSVFDQVGARPDTVVVVDDGSPAPARAELGDFSTAERARLTIIEQANGGVSAARNRALDALAPDIEFIAFLDSDDRWTPDHLARGRIAMDEGADLYFADHRRDASAVTRFAECQLDPIADTRLLGGPDLYWYAGNLLDGILRRSPVGTPTVIFRRAIAPKLRFRTGLSIGEDNLFWMELASRGARAAYSSLTETECGIGVNIFAGTNWGNPKMLRKLLDMAVFCRMAADSFTLPPDLGAWNASWRRQIGHDFALNLLHLLRHRLPVDWPAVFKFLGEDPLMPIKLVSAPFRRRGSGPG